MAAADDELLREAVAGDARPTAVFRIGADGLVPVAVSATLRDALGASDDSAVAGCFEGLGGARVLLRRADDHRPIEVPGAPGRRLVMSARRVGENGIQLRGVDEQDSLVSNTLTAKVVADLVNDETGVVFLDPTGRLLAVNYAFYQFFPVAPGFPKIGAPFAELVRGAIDQGYLPGAAGREARYVDWTVEHFMGESAAPLSVRSAAGRTLTAHRLRLRNGAVAILLIDTTALNSEIDQFRSFVRNTRGVVYVRIASGEPIARVWGTDARKILGVVGDGERIHVDVWRPLVDCRDSEAYAAAEVRRRERREPYVIEFRFRHPKTGETRWLQENSWVATDSATGEVFFDSFMIDITERKEAEAERWHSEQRFREFADMAADWAFEADAEQRMTWISENFEAVSKGVPAERFVGRLWSDIVDDVCEGLPVDQVRQWQRLLSVWGEGRAFRISPLLFRFAGDHQLMIEVSGAPIHDRHGRFVGMRGVARDVTSLVRAREDARAAMLQAEAANRAKSEFIANMSHELRTPLNAIIGFANVMEQELFGALHNDRYRGYAADIGASGQHLLSLVNDVLDLSRIEADRVMLEREPVSVTPEVDRAVSLFRESAGQRRLAVSGDADAVAHADRRLLRQMLINLIGNAVKFTADTGWIDVEVAVTGGAVALHVRDDGIGMTEADILTAMEPFGRAAGADIAGGTGLGLPLTRKLAELHGGTLSIRSEPRRGTTVTLELPRPPAALMTGGDARLSA